MTGNHYCYFRRQYCYHFIHCRKADEGLLYGRDKIIGLIICSKHLPWLVPAYPGLCISFSMVASMFLQQWYLVLYPDKSLPSGKLIPLFYRKGNSTGMNGFMSQVEAVHRPLLMNRSMAGLSSPTELTTEQIFRHTTDGDLQFLSRFRQMHDATCPTHHSHVILTVTRHWSGTTEPFDHPAEIIDLL